jgi:hypothetical protein
VAGDTPGPGIGLVVSGGQTGVDRAALDAAIANGIPYGGWCPRGGIAEDFPDPPGLLSGYPRLRQTPSADPAQRTEWNVRDSDATLVIAPVGGPSSPGTNLTIELALELGRPLLVVDPKCDAATTEAVEFVRRLAQVSRLNFAGPRESQAPGLYEQSHRVIEEILFRAGGR